MSPVAQNVNVEQDIYDRLDPAAKAAYRRAVEAEAAQAAEDRTATHQRATEAVDEQRLQARSQAAEAEQRRRVKVATIARELHDGAESAAERHLVRANDATDVNTRFQESQKAVAAFRRAGDLADLHRAAQKRVTSVVEPAVYRRGGPNSYFADLAAKAQQMHPMHADASARLERYSRGIGWDATEPGPEGDRIRRSLRDITRKPIEARDESERQYRAMTTGASSGGSLVVPAFALADWAAARDFEPVFAEQGTTPRDLPSWGMTVSTPRVTTQAGAGQQFFENAGASEADPNSQYAQAPVLTIVGAVNGSQQLADRAGPDASFDSFVFAQLQLDIDAQVDAAVIAAALANATISTRASFSTAAILSDVGQMSAGLQTAAGVHLQPSAVFTTPLTAEFLAAQVDDQHRGRAIITPAPDMGSRSDGFIGTFPNGLGLYSDGLIPPTGANTKLVIVNKQAVYLYQGAPIPDVFVEPGAGSLTVMFRARQYIAAVTRYPSGVAYTTGAAYPASPTFA